jgi:hypothetical protein
VTAYSIYLQLPSISQGSLLHLQSEDTPCHGDRDPHNTNINLIELINSLIPYSSVQGVAVKFQE